MPNKAVFLDRDHTLIDDPGYLADPQAVKLLPGVELAVKSLVQAGYKIVVVTNQSGIARGLLTEEALDAIHAEMRRQLADRGAHLDAIYYCPFHPEGTVETYARESEFRKPQPGMLLKAAEDLDLDLAQSWMVGDSGRDIEAGQRAGCRTIRIRVQSLHLAGETEVEDVQADYTVRNLVDAARVILRAVPVAPRPPAETRPSVPAATVPERPAPAPAAAETTPAPEPPDDAQVRREILRHVRQLARVEHTDEFSFLKLAGGIAQMLALLALVIALYQMIVDQISHGILWALISGVLQTLALTCFTVHRPK